MKKLTLLLSALMITGAAFAHDGKSGCCKGKKSSECKKEVKAGCADKKGSCCQKKGAETAKK